MMMDTRGCFGIWAIATVILALVGLALKGAGLFSSWLIVLGIAAVPTIGIVVIFVYLMFDWMARGSH